MHFYDRWFTLLHWLYRWAYRVGSTQIAWKYLTQRLRYGWDYRWVCCNYSLYDHLDSNNYSIRLGQHDLVLIGFSEGPENN